MLPPQSMTLCKTYSVKLNGKTYTTLAALIEDAAKVSPQTGLGTLQEFLQKHAAQLLPPAEEAQAVVPPQPDLQPLLESIHLKEATAEGKGVEVRMTDVTLWRAYWVLQPLAGEQSTPELEPVPLELEDELKVDEVDEVDEVEETDDTSAPF